MHNKIFLITINFLLLALVSCNLQPPINDFGAKDEKLKAEKQQKHPPCKSCSILADSFNKVNLAFSTTDLRSYLITTHQIF